MRLIDADALKQTFCAKCDRAQCKDCSINYHLEHFAPTIDAVSLEDYRSMEQTVNKLTKAISENHIKHGHWEYKNLWKGVEAKYCECSACHHPAWWATDYCPNCGAKMDEAEEDG